MLIVLVTELDALLAESGRVPGRISRILQRGTSLPLQPDAFHSQLLTGQALPAAPLTRRLDCPGDADGSWLRADPIGLRPDLSAVWVQPGACLSPDATVVGELKSLFADSGMSFDLPVAERGYLTLESIPDCRFAPPWSLPGVSLDELMPGGKQGRPWRALLSECQIILHQHQEDDVPDGLWFWGGGRLPERDSVNARVERIVATDPVLVALADWLNLPMLSLPAQSNEAPETWPGDSVLVEWPTRFDRSAEDNLEHLEGFLKSAWRRLQFGQLPSIELASRQRVWRMETLDTWRFWARTSREAA